jgi:serine/threonine protein kinase
VLISARYERKGTMENSSTDRARMNAGRPPELENHFHYKKEDDVPFEYIRLLGIGGFAMVDKVKHVETGKQYARKMMISSSTRKQKKNMDAFVAEVHILKTLGQNHHTVTLVSTYTHENIISLLFSPVAQCDLQQFLQNHIETGPYYEWINSYKVLSRSYGCLMNGLRFIHEKGVRHKDIKPQNILISNGNVLFADFGISYAFAEKKSGGGSTTLGKPEALSERYAAPEVANWDNRGRKADVWSLGCVFIEITTVLAGKTLDDLDEFLIQNQDEFEATPSFRIPQASLQKWCKGLRANLPINPWDHDSDLIVDNVRWCSERCPSMMSLLAEDRPTMTDLSVRGMFSLDLKYFCCDDCKGTFGSSDDAAIDDSLKRILGTKTETDRLVVNETFPGAVYWSKPDFAKRLINDGANANNWYSRLDDTPLNYAAKRGNIELVKVLIEVPGINLNYKSRDHCTPLITSITHAQLEIAELLIDTNGVNLDTRDLLGATPLTVACVHGRYEIVKALLLKGVTPFYSEKSDVTPLLKALQNGESEILEYIKRCRGFTSLHRLHLR